MRERVERCLRPPGIGEILLGRGTTRAGGEFGDERRREGGEAVREGDAGGDGVVGTPRLADPPGRHRLPTLALTAKGRNVLLCYVSPVSLGEEVR